MDLNDARKRVVVDYVGPQIDCGRFPIKRAVGETVTVVAHAFADGHEQLCVEALFKNSLQSEWTIRPMAYHVNDEWSCTFTVTELGSYFYTARAWVDRFGTWQSDLEKKLEAGQNIALERKIGAALIRATAQGAQRADAENLHEWARILESSEDEEGAAALALGDELRQAMRGYPDRASATTYHTELAVVVDRPKAVFSTWYELFPRSVSRASDRPVESGTSMTQQAQAALATIRHGTFRDCERLVPEIAALGFDVLYLPPIHPIGQTHRKGRNNATTAAPGDPGSPWAIGSSLGGHKAVHPELGTLADFRHLVRTAGEHGLEVALDLAFQCSPDHPYVTEHPEWFLWRPDGTVQFAENPPKKYQDIIPLNSETEQWRALWEELKSVVLFWIDQGIRNIELYPIDNDALLCYGKMTEDQSNMIVTVVNLDPHHRQSGWVRLPLHEMGIEPRSPFLAHDLLTDDKYIWQGEANYLELDPRVMPGHILHLRRRLRRETDFDYFM